MVKLRIGIDKRVEEKKKNGRKGTIVGNAIGAKQWTVQFDDTNGLWLGGKNFSSTESMHAGEWCTTNAASQGTTDYSKSSTNDRP